MFFQQQTPVILAGNKEQQKKYLGRLIDEPLVAVCYIDNTRTNSLTRLKLFLK